jgi:hypothetical protein
VWDDDLSAEVLGLVCEEDDEEEGDDGMDPEQRRGLTRIESLFTKKIDEF